MTKHGGQSMTEFAAGAAAMALLLLGCITIAGYQEVQRRTSAAARHVAFESAWVGTRGDRAALGRQATLTHLGDEGLTDAVGRGRYVRNEDINVASTTGPTPGLAQGAGRAMVEPLRIVGGFLGGSFDLQAGGLVHGMLSVDLEPRRYLPAPFNGMSVPLRQPFAIMSDAWNAGGPSHVRSRASGLVPTTALTSLQTLWRPLTVPLSLLEPSLPQLCLGLIEPDRIPEDRLSTGRTPLSGRCP